MRREGREKKSREVVQSRSQKVEKEEPGCGRLLGCCSSVSRTGKAGEKGARLGRRRSSRHCPQAAAQARAGQALSEPGGIRCDSTGGSGGAGTGRGHCGANLWKGRQDRYKPHAGTRRWKMLEMSRSSHSQLANSSHSLVPVRLSACSRLRPAPPPRQRPWACFHDLLSRRIGGRSVQSCPSPHDQAWLTRL